MVLHRTKKLRIQIFQILQRHLPDLLRKKKKIQTKMSNMQR
eukprot:UN14296